MKIRRAAFAAFQLLYDLTLGRLDRRLGRRAEQELARDLHSSLKFLFTDHGARIVPNRSVPFPLGFDCAIVTVEVGDMLLRFFRGRGELGVAVGTGSMPNQWEELTLVLDPLMSEPTHIRGGDFQSMEELSRIMEKEMKNLTVERFLQLQQRLGR